MNVITVMSDEHSYQMMQFVDKSILKTPNLDKLAAQSAVFDNCYSPCPVCAPARASFFTGQYVNRIGTWDNSTPYDGTVEGISHRLVQHGKRFTCIGKTHFHHEGNYDFSEVKYAGYMNKPDIGCYFRDEKRGRIGAERRFEKVGIKAEKSFDDRVLQASLEWLETNKDRQDWMLYIGFLDPHFPFYVKQENWDYFNARISQIPDALRPPFTSLNEPLSWLRTYFKCENVPEETVRRILVGYCCAVAELDERIGVLLYKMEELGLTDNTAFIYTSDHGEQLGYHGMWWKCCMFEQSAHIPLFIRVPGEQPRRIAHPVNLVDISPTVCELMDVPQPTGCSGESLLPLVRTGMDSCKCDFTFSEYSAHGMPNSMFMIRWQNYKYVYYCYNKPQLFDLQTDPAEDYCLLSSRPDDSEVRHIAEQCHQRLRSVCDPYEVDARAKAYQRRIKKEMGLTEYLSEKGTWVPHPEHILGGT